MAELERLLPVHCLGESHCLRLRNLVHRTDGGIALHARARFLPDVRATTFATADGLHPDVAGALTADELCVTGLDDDGVPLLRPAHLGRTRRERVATARHAALAGEAVAAPPLLLFAGDMDLHGFLQELGPTTDFELPDDAHHGLDRALARVPYDAVEIALARLVQPFATGLEMLRETGFTRTFVHGLPPRPADAAATARWCHGVPFPATVRSKLTIVMNRLLQAHCARLGFGFLDVWPATSRGGWLLPEFDLDHLHLNQRAARWTLAELGHRLRDDTAGAFHTGQYELLAELAAEAHDGGDHPALDPRATALADGVALARLPAAAFARILRGIAYRADAGNPAAHPDWVGLPRQATVPAELAHFDAERLAALHALLWSDEVAPFLDHAATSPRTAVSVRALRPRDPAALGATQPLGAPPHTQRVLLVVRGSATVGWRSRTGADDLPARPLADGQAVAFDPARWTLHAAAIAPDCEVLELALMPRPVGCERWTIAAGYCDWPIDPLAIALANVAVEPHWEGSHLHGWRETASTLG